MKTRARIGFLLAFAMLAAAIALRSIGSDPSTTTASRGSPRIASNDGSRELSKPARGSDARLPADDSGAAIVAPALPIAATVPTTIHVEGLVSVAGTRALLANARVSIELVQLLGSGLDPGADVSAVARTNQAGAFSFELDVAHFRVGDMFRVRVSSVDEQNRFAEQRRFDSLMRLAPRIDIVVAAPTMLHGLFVGSNALDEEHLEVVANYRRAGEEIAQFAGRAPTVKGAFQIACYFDALPSKFEIELRGRSLAAHWEVATNVLTSDEGALLPLGVQRFDCKVVHENDSPFPDATLRLAPIDRADMSWVSVVALDADGRGHMWLEGFDYELLVGAKGFDSIIDTIDATRSRSFITPRRYVLRSLDANVFLRGRVLFDDGAPAADAYVCATPDSRNREISPAATAGARTNERGEFEFQPGSTGLLHVTAFSREFGLSDAVDVRADGTPLTIRLKRLGSLLVHVNSVVEGSSSSMQYVLVRDGAVVDHGAVDGPPLRIDDVATGPCELYVTARDLGLCGDRSIDLQPGHANIADLELEPTGWGVGTLTHADGRPFASVRVRSADSSWPASVVQILGATITDDAGTFGVLSCGPRSNFDIEFVRPDKPALRAHVRHDEWRLFAIDE